MRLEFLLGRTPDYDDIDVLELGAGCGVVGLALAQHGARCVLTDVAHVVPITRQNVALNGLDNSVTIADYEWGTSPQQPLNTRSFDLIVAADVLYEATTSFAPLAISICAFSKPTTVSWIAFQQRDKDVGAAFASVAAEHGLHCTAVAVADLPPFYRGFGKQMGILQVRLVG